MSRLRIVKGTNYEITGGTRKLYAKDNYEVYSNEQILQKTKGGKTYGSPESPPPLEDKITDIVMFVAGTTDPINTTGKKHEANTDYWRASKENFWHKIKDLKYQFLDLNIEGDFFSWSGDNDTKERNIAAERLLDVMLRTYSGWRKNREVHLHLIGHSHGGNVINQFTQLITSNEAISKSKILKKNGFTEFPKLWKVKSITYLSTPFFQKKHQLNHGKLHQNCKIINVHNEYDLTQQLIADFSLVNLEIFLRNFQMQKFETGLKNLKKVNTSAFDNLTDVSIDDKTEGPFLWRETVQGLLGINQLTTEFITYLQSISLNKPNLGKERDQFVQLLKAFQHWTFVTHNTFNKNKQNRKGGYGRSEFFEDLNLADAIKTINSIFYIKSGVSDSYMLNLLAKVFAAESGITDSIEVNSWSPKKQTNGLSVLDVNITAHDAYNSRNKKALCTGFIKNASNDIHNNNLQGLLMRLLSQFVKPNKIKYITYALHGAELYFTGATDTEIKKLRKSLEIYISLVKKYHVDLVTEKDEKEISDMMKRPGTIPYLAMTSHSLSHTKFWSEVEEGLKSAFSSGKNTGYRKK